MGRMSKVIIIFVISFFISYIIVGFVANAVFASIRWDETATAWDKFREYYIRTVSVNLIPAIILSFVSTTIISLISVKRN